MLIKGKMSAEKIKKGVRLILDGLGENPQSKRLKQTPQRVAEMFMEVLSDTHKDPNDFLKALSEEKHEEMVILKDIPLYSLCEHHLLPFFGVVHVGYIPDVNGRVVGISKLARVVDIITKRPQIQERMTTQIADAISDGIGPQGVAVVAQAEHMCMVMRGVKKPGSNIITSAIRGLFRRRAASRAEFFSLLPGK